MRCALAALVLSACAYTGTFECQQDLQCQQGMAVGVCEPTTGFCSAPDDMCISGRRYDTTAGDLANACVNGPTGCEAWSSRYFTPCRIPAPFGNLSITAGTFTYDTSDGKLTDPSGIAIPQPSVVIDGVRLVSVNDLYVGAGATLRVTGDKPIAIAAWGGINIEGIVDASSHRTSTTGPGSNPMQCAAIAAGAGTDAPATPTGAGGGGGGGFKAHGGTGGRGNALTTLGGTRGGMLATPTVLHGGCNGGDSGRAGPGATAPANAMSRAGGGKGGGAILLSARLGLVIMGTVAASGGGGAGSPMNALSGGGGGGAGGLVVLEAGISIGAHGIIMAIGGGGGGSANTNSAADAGEDGYPDNGAGGIATGCVGTGGVGSVGADGTGGTGGNGSCGGAGAGGGDGYVLAFATQVDQTSGTSRPAIAVNPF